MRNRLFIGGASAVAALILLTWTANAVTMQSSTADGGKARLHTTTPADFERWMTELSNWGRWGKDDRIGAVNLITTTKRLQASALVKEGRTVSLSHDLTSADKGNSAGAGIRGVDGFKRTMVISPDPPLVLEGLEIEFHGGRLTHMDGLCHVVYKDKLYNGLDFKQTATAGGCTELGIEGMRDGVVTRAVLIDLPRLKGVDSFPPKTRIYREDIEAWEKRTGARVGPGDALLIRTGRWTPDAQGATNPRAALDASFLPFLKDRDVAILGEDTSHDMQENIPGLNLTLFHKFAIVARGMTLLDNLDLDSAAANAERLNRWEFMIAIAPLRVPGGTGSPVNPIAMF